MRVRDLTAAAEHTATFDGCGPPSLHVGEHWISIGPLAYEPATGQLLRLREPPAES